MLWKMRVWNARGMLKLARSASLRRILSEWASVSKTILMAYIMVLKVSPSNIWKGSFDLLAVFLGYLLCSIWLYSECSGATACMNSENLSWPSRDLLQRLNINSTSVKVGFFSGAILLNLLWNSWTVQKPLPSVSNIVNASIRLKSFLQAKSILAASSFLDYVTISMSWLTMNDVS